MPQALMLLSGGLDSVSALAWAIVSFDYGQRYAREVAAAAAVAAHYGVPHQTVALAPICGSRLTETVAPTYVPNRNLILISYAAAHFPQVGVIDPVSYAIPIDWSGCAPSRRP